LHPLHPAPPACRLRARREQKNIAVATAVGEANRRTPPSDCGAAKSGWLRVHPAYPASGAVQFNRRSNDRFIRGLLAYRSVKVYFIDTARSCAPEADREDS
jgi:hypothetical protein